MNLISTVVGIGFLAMTVGAGISYVNPAARSVTETMALINAGFQGLSQAYLSRQMTGAPALDPASWKSALFPAYGFEPKAPSGASWSYGADVNGRWFCLAAPRADRVMRAAIDGAGRQYSAASYLISGACGRAPAAAPTGAAGVSGDSVAATLWLSREVP